MLAQGRPVVLVGDLNIAPYLPDHCDWCGRASQPSAQSQFLHHRPDRQWFQSILSTGGGPLTDIFRKFHTDRSEFLLLLAVTVLCVLIGCNPHILKSLPPHVVQYLQACQSFLVNYQVSLVAT